ncbi:hypothetical protein [Scytonema sp. UIC 10036]|uniref:hypothetical protein n=1 Tax=Scytonema sp. UIC 10036 TaxID=2304196 RepID=UPI00140FB87C|nr:hypothetical protein [Scytonema sp. UIC 10036]
MVTVYLKTGEIVQVRPEELEDFIYANIEKIQPIRVQRRRERKGTIPSNDAASISSR